MDAVTLESLQVIIEAQTRGLKEEMNRVKKEVKGMTDAVNRETSKVRDVFKNLFKGAIFAYGLTKMAQLAKESTKMAMEVEGAVQQIKRTMGESSQMFLKWAKDNGLAFNLAQSDVMKFGAIYSNLLSGFAGGTKQTMQYTQELLKASSIIASGTGRTMEDVMERIRSGLLGNTEAIEDLGINVNVAMLQSTEAFKRFANGQEWNDLSFQTQQQIRLFAILEQTSSKFGNEIMNNTNSSMQQLVAVLKDVWLNLGNAFLPILNIVLPILTNFAMALRTVTGYVAAFMQTLFGKSKKAVEGPKIAANTMNKAKSAALGGANAQNGYNKALDKTGETAKKTAKEVNRLLGGFDEINSISDSGSKGGGLPKADKTPLPASPLPDIGGIGPIDWGFDEEPDMSGIESAVNKVKNFLKPLTEAFDRLKKAALPVVETVGNLLMWLFDNILVPFAKWTIGEALPAFLDVISGALTILNPLLLSFKPLALFLWDNFLQPIASWTGGVIVDVLKGLANVLTNIGNWMSEHISVVEKITTVVVAFFAAWKVVQLMAFIQQTGGLVGAFSNITAAIKACTIAKISDKLETIQLTLMYAKDFVMSIGSSIKALGDLAKGFAKSIAAKIADKLETLQIAALYAKDFVMSIVNSTIALVKQAAQFAKNTALKIADTAAQVAMTAATVTWNAVCGLATAATTALGGAIAFLTSPIGIAIAAIAAIIAIGISLYKNWDFIKAKAIEIWGNIKDIFNNFKAWLRNVFQTDWSNCFGSLGNLLNMFFRNVSNIFGGVKQIFGGIIDFIAGVFTGNWERAWHGVINIFKGIFNMLGGIAKAPLNAVIGLVNMCIDGLNKISFTAPDWVPFVGGKHFGVNLPKIPYLAKGGIVDSATLAVVGEAGKEAVMPLENNTGWITQLAEKVASRMPQSSTNNDKPITLKFEFKVETLKFAKTICTTLNKLGESNGGVIPINI